MALRSLLTGFFNGPSGGRQLSFARLGAVIAAKERRESIEPKQGLEEAGDSKLEAARATAG